MKKEIKELFPSWCGEGKKAKYDCIMSDDLDSLMCAIAQERVFNNKVKHFFYSNSTGGNQRYYSVENYSSDNELLGLDIALEGDIKCWDNHVVKVSSNDTVNQYSANMNIALNIHKGNYTKKAIVSSFITMLSYYEVDIEKWSKDKLLVLCSIDGLYHPFKNSYFTKQGTENLKLLGYDFLANFIQENLDEIMKLEEELNLKGKIWVNNKGKLETNIDLLRLSQIFGFEIKLTEEIFVQQKTFVKKFDRTSKEVLNNRLEDKNKTLFNLALVKRDCCVYSYY